jgi:PAS domain S-box-containing protein
MSPTDDLQGILYQNQILTNEIQRRVNQLSAINSVAAMVSQSLDLNATLQLALDSVLQVIRVEAAGISLIDDEAGELVLRAQRGWKRDFVNENPMRLKLGEGLSGQVLETDDVVVTGDLTGDTRLAFPAVLEEKIQAMAMAPMHARGRIIGIVSVMNYKPYNFTAEETDVLRVIADQLGVALDNARLYEDTRAKQSRLSAIIDSTADAIITLDNNGVIDLVNTAAENLLRIRAEYLTGQHLDETYLHSRLREGILKIMRGTPQTNPFFEMMMEDGQHLLVSVSPVHAPEPMVDRGEDKGGWVIVVQDITHLRDSERNRVRFIQTAAHDLNNPLSVTMSALMYLKNQEHPEGDEAEAIDLAITSINRMQNLVDDLLHLEQIQSGVGTAMKQVDVADLLERAMLEAQPMIRHKAQNLQLEVARDMPEIEGDPRWLSRALVNLLGNATKYTPEGGKIVMRAWYDREAREVLMEVEDNGMGIPSASQKRIFESFYRDPKVRDTIAGTGLGLSIVKSVVDQHNGRLYLSSEEGQGSLFGIGLPAATGSAPG